MNLKEFQSLRQYSIASRLQRNHSFGIKNGRRAVKSKAKHVGMWLKDSTIKPEVGINRVFVQRP